MTQRGALRVCAAVFGELVIPKKDREDDAGEFLYVGGTAVVEGRGGFLAYSAIGRDGCQVDGKGKCGVFREGVWRDRLGRDVSAIRSFFAKITSLPFYRTPSPHEEWH